MNNTPIRPGMAFSITTQGGVHTVTYKKAPYKISSLIISMVPLSIVSILPAALFHSGTAVLIGGVILPIAAFIVLNNLRSKPASFLVMRNKIVADGASYETSRITGFYLEAPYTSEQPIAVQSGNSPNLIAVGRSIPFNVGMASTHAVAKGVGTAVQGAQLATNAATKRLINDYAACNVRIVFAYGQQRITLASGLTAVTAQALYPQVLALMKQGL